MAIQIGLKEGKPVFASWPADQSETKRINESTRTIDFVYSEESMDRDNEVIEVKGWNLTNFKKNPVAQWAHDWRGLPIGKGVSVKKSGNQLVGGIKFATEEDGSALGEAVYRLYLGGFLNTVSVGFLPTEWMWNEAEMNRVEDDDGTRRKPKNPLRNFKKQELLEISAVPVPAHPNAGIIRDLSEFDSTDIRHELDAMKAKGILDKHTQDYLFGLYDAMEQRKEIYVVGQKQCQHEEPCEEVRERGECDYQGNVSAPVIDNDTGLGLLEDAVLSAQEARKLVGNKAHGDDEEYSGFGGNTVIVGKHDICIRSPLSPAHTVVNPSRAVGDGDMEDKIPDFIKNHQERIAKVDEKNIEAMIAAEEKKISGKRGLPLSEDRDMTWNSSAAQRRVARWASSDGSGDKDKINFSKFGQAFVVLRDPDNADNMGSYALPFADVVDGTLTAIPRGIFAAAAAIMGARGGVELTDADRRGSMRFLGSYYSTMELEPPWERSLALESWEKSQLVEDWVEDGMIDFDPLISFLSKGKAGDEMEEEKLLTERFEKRNQDVFCSVDGAIIKGEALAALLNRLIDAMVNEDRSRSEVIASMAEAAGIESSTVNQILSGTINCPPIRRLQGFARALNTSLGRLRSAAERDGCSYSDSSEYEDDEEAWEAVIDFLEEE
jgi:hypothetical protein